MTPHVKIKPRETAPRTYITDILIYFGGENYCSRVPYLVSDTPEQRALHGQLFMKRHNARVAEDHYNATLSAVDVAMSFDMARKADRGVVIKSHDDLIAFAKEGSPILNTLPKQRPGLRVIK
jgi:hypothetical protein